MGGWGKEGLSDGGGMQGRWGVIARESLLCDVVFLGDGVRVRCFCPAARGYARPTFCLSAAPVFSLSWGFRSPFSLGVLGLGGSVTWDEAMFFKKRNKEEHRYYLLPGMGRANKRKRAVFFRWALLVGVLASLLLGYFIYRANRIGL